MCASIRCRRRAVGWTARQRSGVSPLTDVYTPQLSGVKLYLNVSYCNCIVISDENESVSHLVIHSVEGQSVFKLITRRQLTQRNFIASFIESLNVRTRRGVVHGVVNRLR